MLITVQCTGIAALLLEVIDRHRPNLRLLRKGATLCSPGRMSQGSRISCFFRASELEDVE